MTEKIITWEQYSKHTINIDCWLLIDGYIYDSTTYLVQHPGGQEILLKYTGLDASLRFKQANHSQYAKSLRDARKIGKIQSPDMPEGHQQRVKNIKNEYAQKKKQRQLQKKKSSNIHSSGVKKGFPLADIAKHNNSDDCWVIFNHKVYDVTKYLSEHPGGANQILNFAGKDGTDAFKKVGHGQFAQRTRQKLCIGYVEGFGEQKNSSGSSALNILFILIAILALAYGASTFLL